MLFLTNRANRTTAGTTVTPEPPIAFAGPKVLICRRRKRGTTSTMGPLKVIKDVVRKIKNKTRNSRSQQQDQQQQQLAASSVPTPQTETPSNTTETPCDRLVQEQDVETIIFENDVTSSRAQHNRTAAAKPLNETPIIYAANPTYGIRRAFALPHDCPTIIEGEEWDSGECSDPEEMPSRPNNYSQSTAAVHTAAAAASGATASAALETTALHSQTPTLDIAFLQSGSRVPDGPRNFASEGADHGWKAFMNGRWRPSSIPTLSDLAFKPFFDCVPESPQCDPNNRSAQGLQPSTKESNEAVSADPEAAASPSSHWKGTEDQTEQRTSVLSAVPCNPFATESQEQRCQQEGEGSSMGSGSFIASIMERVVTLLEGSAAMLSSCGVADIIDESQLVVSDGRIRRSHHQPSAPAENNTTTTQCAGDSPIIPVYRQRDSVEGSDDEVSSNAKLNSEKEKDFQSSSADEATKTEDDCQDGKLKSECQEHLSRNTEDNSPHISETTFSGNKQENKEVEESKEARCCLIGELNDSSGLHNLSDQDSSFAMHLPGVAGDEIKQISALPAAFMLQVCGSYITACRADGSRLHFHHFETNQPHLMYSLSMFYRPLSCAGLSGGLQQQQKQQQKQQQEQPQKEKQQLQQKQLEKLQQQHQHRQQQLLGLQQLELYVSLSGI
ncbi:uncharacterized protein EMH_0048350 [Eimeria mitis]|uniref:Uncharacterized protein n=1 Tax=Eimeria mitis TaxID=44415 RepID=U6K507_9EIME|nr:uncharacterized protein EMH_0048350 [Eimeria mitis]CDJ32789.1 hypothetical protein, conserved [Eimeria mitis]